MIKSLPQHKVATAAVPSRAVILLRVVHSMLLLLLCMVIVFDPGLEDVNLVILLKKTSDS